MLVAYQDWRGGQRGRPLPATTDANRREKVKAKA